MKSKLNVLILATLVVLATCVFVFESSSDAKDKDTWEYKIEPVRLGDGEKTEGELNGLGADGWELTAVQNDNPNADPSLSYCIFKRRKQ